MIPMKVEDGVESYVKKHLTKKSTSGVTSTFEFEDGTLSAKLEVPRDEKGVVKSIDLNKPESLTTCNVKSWSKGASNANVKHNQTFGKLAGTAKEGYKALLEHANTLAEEVEGN